MRGQTAFEMLVTVATLLAFSVPIVLLALSSSNIRLEDLSLFHGRSTVQQLSDSINEVYLQGEGAKRSIILDLPSNTKNLTISGNTVTLLLSTTSGQYEISHPILADTNNYSIQRTGMTNVVMIMQGGKVIVQ